MKLVKGKNVYTYVLLSLAFIIVNLATLSNLAPWIDEVMMLDTSYNMAFHGRWETTAWYRVVGAYPFSTYPPLYQMTAAVWMWLFGGNMVVVRSLNLLIAFMLGGICLRLMERHGVNLTLWTTGLFSVLFWGTSEMAWMYRNGRPDMLGALFVSLTVLAIDHYLQTRSLSARMTVIASSALLFCSGIQAAVYLCALCALPHESGRALRPLLPVDGVPPAIVCCRVYGRQKPIVVCAVWFGCREHVALWHPVDAGRWGLELRADTLLRAAAAF